jgi:Cys-rich repeat protein
MIKKLLAPITVTFALGLVFSSMDEVSAAQECKADSDCKAGEFCILALTPHVCKAPQEAGAPCKRDVVCASKKCDMAAGVCK